MTWVDIREADGIAAGRSDRDVNPRKTEAESKDKVAQQKLGRAMLHSVV